MWPTLLRAAVGPLAVARGQQPQDAAAVKARLGGDVEAGEEQDDDRRQHRERAAEEEHAAAEQHRRVLGQTAQVGQRAVEQPLAPLGLLDVSPHVLDGGGQLFLELVDLLRQLRGGGEDEAGDGREQDQAEDRPAPSRGRACRGACRRTGRGWPRRKRRRRRGSRRRSGPAPSGATTTGTARPGRRRRRERRSWPARGRRGRGRCGRNCRRLWTSRELTARRGFGQGVKVAARRPGAIFPTRAFGAGLTILMKPRRRGNWHEGCLRLAEPNPSEEPAWTSMIACTSRSSPTRASTRRCRTPSSTRSST